MEREKRREKDDFALQKLVPCEQACIFLNAVQTHFSTHIWFYDLCFEEHRKWSSK